jgi:hypothetical protein
VNPNKVVIELWGQRDSNPRPPAPRAYTHKEVDGILPS